VRGAKGEEDDQVGGALQVRRQGCQSDGGGKGGGEVSRNGHWLRPSGL